MMCEDLAEHKGVSSTYEVTDKMTLDEFIELYHKSVKRDNERKIFITEAVFRELNNSEDE